MISKCLQKTVDLVLEVVREDFVGKVRPIVDHKTFPMWKPTDNCLVTLPIRVVQHNSQPNQKGMFQ